MRRLRIRGWTLIRPVVFVRAGEIIRLRLLFGSHGYDLLVLGRSFICCIREMILHRCSPNFWIWHSVKSADSAWQVLYGIDYHAWAMLDALWRYPNTEPRRPLTAISRVWLNDLHVVPFDGRERLLRCKRRIAILYPEKTRNTFTIPRRWFCTIHKKFVKRLHYWVKRLYADPLTKL